MNATEQYSHLIEIDESNRRLTIFRIFAGERQLYSSIGLPEMNWTNDPAKTREFCRMLGESILLDSPQARRLFLNR